MPEKTRVGRVPVLILRPKDKAPVRAGLLRIHGGGCILGMKEITEEFERYFTEAIENNFTEAIENNFTEAIENM